MPSLVDHIQRWIADPPPDNLFEISETCLAAASPRQPDPGRREVLGERALAPSPSAPNLVKPHLFRDALPRLCPNPGRRSGAALVIPDYSVRMAILDFEEFPAGEPERAALLRFRLKKSVPFHIDEAQLAYSIQLQEPKHIEVLAIAIARPILDEYERLFTDAGFRVGLVMPSSLAALRLCADGAPAGLTLLAKAAGTTLSVLLIQQQRVRLARCLDLAHADPEDGETEDRSLLALLQQTLAYAEDQLGESVARLLLCGFGPETESLGRLAQRELGIPYAPVRSRFGAPLQENAGLLGLLEQYAA